MQFGRRVEVPPQCQATLRVAPPCWSNISRSCCRLRFPCCSLGGANWIDTLFFGNSLAKKASCSELAPARLKKWQMNQILTPKIASNLKPFLASNLKLFWLQPLKNESAKPKNWSQNWLQKSGPFRRKEFWMLGFIHSTSAKGKLPQIIASSEAFSSAILHKPLAMTLIASHALCRT